jgi:cation:H+ antiporter
MIWLPLFVTGIIILLFSTHLLVKSAEKLALVWRISPFIIGTTIVAWGTSLPELVVGMVALARQDPGLALGNVIGSNIVNVFMVLPAGILIGKLRLGATKTQRNGLILLAVTIFFILLQVLHLPLLFSGLLLISLGIVVTVGEYELGLFGRVHEDSRAFKKNIDERLNSASIIFMILSIAGVILGGVLVVNSAEVISQVSGYSTTILGLSLIAATTSLPELLTTIFAQEEHQEKITIGNIIGSNIYNLLFIGGLISCFAGAKTVLVGEWGWLAFSTFCLVLILTYFKGKSVPKAVGLFLLFLLIVYLFSLV